ncbi:MAG: Hsp20/alpha crystallin family protein [Clostridia bacterium]|nr:Hsp20/alpha crystallin family protein [Clostridia bacterium]
MSIIRWDPIGDLNRIRHEMNKMLAASPLGHGNWPAIAPEPRVDVYQTDGEVRISAELPGIDAKEDVEINVEDEVVYIAGEFKRQQEHREDNYYHSERYFGRFSRTVALPVEVKKEEARANYEKGVLTITIPKAQNQRFRGHRVEIQ